MIEALQTPGKSLVRKAFGEYSLPWWKVGPVPHLLLTRLLLTLSLHIIIPPNTTTHTHTQKTLYAMVNLFGIQNSGSFKILFSPSLAPNPNPES